MLSIYNNIFLDLWILWLVLIILLVFGVRWVSFYVFGEKEKEEEREKKGLSRHDFKNPGFWDKYDVLNIVVIVFFVILTLATIRSCLGGG